MSEKLHKLEQKLANLKRSHQDSWDIYGGELCAGDMIRKEEELEKEIEELKKKENINPENSIYIIDD